MTVVSLYKNKDELKNVRDFVLNASDNVDILLSQIFTHGPNSVMRNLLTQMPVMCSDNLQVYYDSEISGEKFDVILLSLFIDFCYLSVVHDQQVFRLIRM